MPAVSAGTVPGVGAGGGIDSSSRCGVPLNNKGFGTADTAGAVELQAAEVAARSVDPMPTARQAKISQGDVC